MNDARVLCWDDIDALLAWPELEQLSDQAHHLYLKMFHSRWVFCEENISPVSVEQLRELMGAGARNRDRAEAVILELCRLRLPVSGRPALLTVDFDRGVVLWDALWTFRSLDRERRIAWWRTSATRLRVGGLTEDLSPVYLLWALRAAQQLGDLWSTWVQHFKSYNPTSSVSSASCQMCLLCDKIPWHDPGRLQRALDTWRARFSWHYNDIENRARHRRPGGQPRRVPFIASPQIVQDRPPAPQTQGAPVSPLAEFERRVAAEQARKLLESNETEAMDPVNIQPPAHAAGTDGCK